MKTADRFFPIAGLPAAPLSPKLLRDFTARTREVHVCTGILGNARIHAMLNLLDACAAELDRRPMARLRRLFRR